MKNSLQKHVFLIKKFSFGGYLLKKYFDLQIGLSQYSFSKKYVSKSYLTFK